LPSCLSVRIGRYVDFADALHLTGSAGTARG
jgi:hypothetical protein